MDKKNVLVTGATKGIGLAIAKQLSKYYDVYICGRSIENLKKVCEENRFKNYYSIDLSQEGSVEKLFNQLNVDIDILVNNAGVYYYNSIEDMSNEEIMNTINLNSVTPLKLSKLVIPHMKKKRWGRIINIGSISGVMGEANASVYSMTKASLIGMTKALALELAQDNITVNVINPGWVDTDLINNENLEGDFSKQDIIETIPQRRFVTPEEIASAVEFLVSNRAKTITGQSINICAGLSVGF